MPGREQGRHAAGTRRVISRRARVGLRRARGALLLAACAMGLGAAPKARAAEIEGVRFAERVSVGGQDLELLGVGLLRYRLLFKGYVAALYVEPGVASERTLDDVPKRLEIEYFWPIEGDQFGPAGETILSRTLDSGTLGALRSRLDALDTSYVSVQPGDRYTLTYRPGIGTELALNGTPLHLVPGEDFARHYFGIWLGEDPIDDDLRDRLLGR